MRMFRKIPRAWIGLLLIATILLSIAIPTVSVLADDGGVTDLTLYERASELTREFATALSPGSGVENLYMIQATNSESLLLAGNAGALLGYPDVSSDDRGIVGWLLNSYTGSSQTITYDQIIHMVGAEVSDNENAAASNNPFFQYAGYGEALTDMGLISTVRPGIESMGRIATTGIVIIVYLLSNVAPFLFQGALSILGILNPFRLFETAINGTTAANLGIISGIAEYIGDIYTAIQNFSILFLFPILLALTIVSVLMFTKGSAMKKFGRYGLRVFMLFAGLPLIGATYTGLIDDLDSSVAVGSGFADYLILSSYVDFENWVTYSQLAPPEGHNIRHPRGQSSGDDMDRSVSSRSLIMDVNGMRANHMRAYGLRDRYAASSQLEDIVSIGDERTVIEDGARFEGKRSFTSVMNILTRHFSTARYTSSDWDGEVSGQIQRILAQDGGSIATDSSIVHMYALSATDGRTISQRYNPFDSSDEVWMKSIHWNGEDNEVDTSAKGLFTKGYAANSDLFRFGPYRMHIYNSGDLSYSTHSGGFVSNQTPSRVTEKLPPINDIGDYREAPLGGLSAISMYNFLNTTFTNTGLTIYSPSLTASDLSRDAYASVSFGSTGVASLARWVENVTVMLCLSVLAIAYGLMMISVSIKSLPRILSGVFGTAFGSIAFITKLLISTAVLIIQIVGMIFLYSLSENIIMTMLLNFNDLVNVSGEFFGSGLIFEFLGSFMVIVITSAVTFFMIRNMKVFKELMEEVVSNSINRMMGLLDTSTGGQGLDIGKSTGGRIGGDGKLTEDAKQPTGIAGIPALLGEAHGLEAAREQLAQEKGLDTGGIGSKIAARATTAKDLIGASAKDGAKGMLGIDGKSLDREREAKNRGIQGLMYNDGLHDDFLKSRGITDNDEDGASQDIDSDVDVQGRTVDENGDVVRDEHGNAVDAEGNVISDASPLAVAGGQALRGDDGTLLDANGNAYTDELGNAFYEDEDGNLIDEVGNYAALDDDGILRASDKPVPALDEASELEAMRFDPENYENMVESQDASHYGLDKDGNIVGDDGNALILPNGEAVELDGDGFIVDSKGNAVPANELEGYDEDGFEAVEDEDTGNMVLKHRGDAAMKHASLTPEQMAKSASLAAMAKHSNKLNELSNRADERVDNLKKKGASPYAIKQAERHADSMREKAKVGNEAFSKALQSGNKNTGYQPVSPDHVKSAVRGTKASRDAFNKDATQLKQMRKDGASPNAIARQEQKVEAKRKEVAARVKAEQDLRTAHKTGRSFNEVSEARRKVDRAEASYAKAQNLHARAVESGSPKQDVARLQNQMDKRANVLSKAQSNMDRVSKKPAGTPQQIQKASLQYDQAKATYDKTTSHVNNLNNPTQQEMRKAKKEQIVAKRAMDQAARMKQRTLAPKGWSSSHLVPEVNQAPLRSQNESYATLTSAGVSTYDEYKQQVKSQTSAYKQNASKLKQSQARLQTLRKSNRPPQIIEQAEAQVRDLKQKTHSSQEKVTRLKDNAQGLLKKGGFQPTVATRPIRQNGTQIINEMVQMGHTQKMYDKLAYQEKTGTITDAGKKQMRALDGRIQNMRKRLVHVGIDEDRLRDSATINNSTKHMQQSWDAYVNGESVEG